MRQHVIAVIRFSCRQFLRRTDASAATDRFGQQKGDIDQVWQIYLEFAGQVAGRKHVVEVSIGLPSYLCQHAWESYAENLWIEGFDFHLAQSSLQIQKTRARVAYQPEIPLPASDLQR